MQANILSFIILGLGTGIFSGLFGIGGGIILVPLLVLWAKLPQHKATALSMVALLLPVGIGAVVEYIKAGKISVAETKQGLWIALGLFVGAYFGAKLAVKIPQDVLRKGFAFLLIGVALRIWFVK